MRRLAYLTAFVTACVTALAACDAEDACYASCNAQYSDCVDEGTNPDICTDFLSDCEAMCFAEPGSPPP